MKNLKFIFVLAISIIAIGCGSDDDDNNEPADPTLTPALLAGTYNLNFFESTQVIKEVVTGGVATTTIEEEGDTFESSNIVFDANSMYEFNYQYRLTRETTFNNESSESESTIVNPKGNGIYVTNDDNQTIRLGDVVYTVTRFNDSELRLTLDNEVEEGNKTTTVSQELRFARQ